MTYYIPGRNSIFVEYCADGPFYRTFVAVAESERDALDVLEPRLRDAGYVYSWRDVLSAIGERPYGPDLDDEDVEAHGFCSIGGNSYVQYPDHVDLLDGKADAIIDATLNRRIANYPDCEVMDVRVMDSPDGETVGFEAVVDKPASNGLQHGFRRQSLQVFMNPIEVLNGRMPWTLI